MKKFNNIFSILTLIIFISASSCKKDIDTSQVTEKVIDDIKNKSEILNLIQNNLQNEYALLDCNNDLEKERVINNFSQEYASADIAKSEINSIIRRKEKLKMDKLEFRNCKVNLNTIESSFRIENGVAVVNAVINYQLPTNSIDSETGKPIITEGTDFYDYKISKINNIYLIIEKSKVADFPISEIVSEIGDEYFPNNTNDDDSRGVLGTYSATNAVNFAITKYNNIPTSGYYDYSSIGGDCTNFLSHCLKSGGWQQVNNWFWKSNGNSGNNMTDFQRSPSWSGAAKFYEYITNTGANRVTSKFSNIEVYHWYSWAATLEAFRNATYIVAKGDIVQLSSSTDKTTVHHSTIVTSKDATAKKIFVTYRNATGYPVAKDKYIGDFTGGQYVHGFSVKASY